MSQLSTNKSLFRDHQKNPKPKCTKEQHITDLEDNVVFPDYTGDCIFIHNNEYIQDIPIFPITVEYVSISNNYNLERLKKKQFPEHLIELHIQEMEDLQKIYLPKYLQRLVIEDMNMPSKFFKKLLPNNLVVLILSVCADLDFDYDDLPDTLLSLELIDCTITNKSKMISIFNKFKDKHPNCNVKTEFTETKTEFEFIPRKNDNLNENLKAYNVLDNKESQITNFLANNKYFIVGKCLDMYFFIDKSKLETNMYKSPLKKKNLCKLSDIGLITDDNSYIKSELLYHIIKSRHKYWLFEKEKHYFDNQEPTMFNLVMLRQSNPMKNSDYYSSRLEIYDNEENWYNSNTQKTQQEPQKTQQEPQKTQQEPQKTQQEPQKTQQDTIKKDHPSQKKRCKKGTIRNKKTGLCEEKKNRSIEKIESKVKTDDDNRVEKKKCVRNKKTDLCEKKIEKTESKSKSKQKRCGKGTHRNKKTGLCEKF
jgi:hypothetical protein